MQEFGQAIATICIHEVKSSLVEAYHAQPNCRNSFTIPFNLKRIDRAFTDERNGIAISEHDNVPFNFKEIGNLFALIYAHREYMNAIFV